MHANRVKHVHHARCILKKQGLLGGKLDTCNNNSAISLLDGKRKERKKGKGEKKEGRKREKEVNPVGWKSSFKNWKQCDFHLRMAFDLPV